MASCFGVLTILASILLPWWLSIVLALACAFYFKLFFEIVIVGLIIDSIYGSGVIGYHFSYLFTLVMTIIFIMILKLKDSLSMY